MKWASEEFVDFLAAGFTSAQLIDYIPSDETRERLRYLVHQGSSGLITDSEDYELKMYVYTEQLIEIAKARARRKLSGKS